MENIQDIQNIANDIFSKFSTFENLVLSEIKKNKNKKVPAEQNKIICEYLETTINKSIALIKSMLKILSSKNFSLQDGYALALLDRSLTNDIIRFLYIDLESNGDDNRWIELTSIIYFDQFNYINEHLKMRPELQEYILKNYARHINQKNAKITSKYEKPKSTISMCEKIEEKTECLKKNNKNWYDSDALKVVKEFKEKWLLYSKAEHTGPITNLFNPKKSKVVVYHFYTIMDATRTIFACLQHYADFNNYKIASEIIEKIKESIAWTNKSNSDDWL